MLGVNNLALKVIYASKLWGITLIVIVITAATKNKLTANGYLLASMTSWQTPLYDGNGYAVPRRIQLLPREYS